MKKYNLLILEGYAIKCTPKKLQETIKLLKEDKKNLMVNVVEDSP